MNYLPFVGRVLIGLPFAMSGFGKLAAYGATTIAGGDGSRQPTANELQGARYQGRKIAETAKKLHG